jgi:hypothetical protein
VPLNERKSLNANVSFFGLSKGENITFKELIRFSAPSLTLVNYFDKNSIKKQIEKPDGKIATNYDITLGPATLNYMIF